MRTSTSGDVTLVVRECGERTAEACVSLLRVLFPGQPIQRVSGPTFIATLHASLREGLRAGRPWTLCLDADVLPLPALREFVAEAKQLPAHFFEAQALVADKLLPARRPAGNHLYRTELLAEAIGLIPNCASLRPESAMIDAMKDAGHPYHQAAWLIGLHDFGQSAQDIYNKAALHSHKHAYLADALLPLWHLWAEGDVDYRIALTAYVETQGSMTPAQVSRDWRREEAATALKNLLTNTIHPHTASVPRDFSELAILLAQAPHSRPEAATLRQRIEGDVLGVMAQQRRQYALTLPRWQRWLFRAWGRYPFLASPR